MASLVSRYIAVFILLTSGCAFAQTNAPVLIDPKVRYQTFEGWGVSLAWWAKVVGSFPDACRNDYMEKVFDPAKGLGLNIVRYNIGGGENPAIDKLPLRSDMEGFEPAPGKWNWDADPGQRWVLQQAKARGVNLFEAFSNSPPYWMTVSGSVTGSKGGKKNNLAPEHIKDFAEYLATVVERFKDHEGIVFRTAEPLNEPNSYSWFYGNGQEGCRFAPNYQPGIIGALGQALADRHLATRLSASDENGIDNALNSFHSYPKETLNLLFQINTHSYFGDKRTELARVVAAAHKNLWMSEYGDGDPSGLTLSDRIIGDMREMHPAAWIYWQAVDGEKWGLLTNEMDGSVSEPQMGEKYWVMTNFTRFIRPGSVFIDIQNEHSVAALNAAGDTLTIVTTNHGDDDKKISYNLSRFDTASASVTAYRTSSAENLVPLSNLAIANAHLDSVLPPKSVTTFVIHGVASATQ